MRNAGKQRPIQLVAFSAARSITPFQGGVLITGWAPLGQEVGVFLSGADERLGNFTSSGGGRCACTGGIYYHFLLSEGRKSNGE